jgi:hypothetical protein
VGQGRRGEPAFEGGGGEPAFESAGFRHIRTPLRVGGIDLPEPAFQSDGIRHIRTPVPSGLRGMWRGIRAVRITAVTWWLVTSEPAQLLPARSQMALVALVTAVPALILLYVLGQRGEMAEEPAASEVYTGPAGRVQ